MHRLIFLRIIICFLTVGFFNSCSKNGNNTNFVSFELDGVLWQTNQASVTTTQSNSSFIMTLIAYNTKNERIQLEIVDFNAPHIGTFVISQGNQNNILYAPSGKLDQTTLSGLSCAPISGDVTITYFDNTGFSGTFQANVCGSTGQKIIRNGTFSNVPVQ